MLWEGVDWIHLAQGRDKWQAILNSVMNFQVSYTVGKVLSSHSVSQ